MRLRRDLPNVSALKLRHASLRSLPARFPSGIHGDESGLVLLFDLWYRTPMNNRLAMCLVGPVQLSLGYTQAAPRLWKKLVERLRQLPEFVEVRQETILLRSQLVHLFTPATARPPFPGAPDFLAAQWSIMLGLSDRECLCMLGTQFYDGTQVYEFPVDLPLAQLDPFATLVEDVASFLPRLSRALAAAGFQNAFQNSPVLNLDDVKVVLE